MKDHSKETFEAHKIFFNMKFDTNAVDHPNDGTERKLSNTFDEYTIHHAWEDATWSDDNETKAYFEREIVNLLGGASSPLPTDNESTEEGGVNVSEAQENSIVFSVNQPVNNVASTNNGLGGNKELIRYEQDNNMAGNGPSPRVNQGRSRVPNELVQANDVLFTGTPMNHHPGNKEFNKLLNDNAPRYRQFREREQYVRLKEKAQIKKGRIKKGQRKTGQIKKAKGDLPKGIKTAKGDLLEGIVKAVHAKRGRFLRKTEDGTGWEEMDSKWARDKVSIRLRDFLKATSDGCCLG